MYNVNNEELYIGMVNVGGIHDFISESRKLVELHYGSKISNEIVSHILASLNHNSTELNAMLLKLKKEIENILSIEEFIIPPGEFIGINDYSYPNQLLFQFTGTPQTNEIEFALKRFITEYFLGKGEESFALQNSFEEYRENWNKQWQDSLPVFFSSVKVNDDFKKCHLRLQKKMIAHKLNRRFEQWQAGAPIPKCIQCGHREVIGPTDSSMSNKSYWDDRVKALIQQGKLKSNERLCAVCLGKRLLAMNDNEINIPTTTFMAAFPFFSKLPGIMTDDKDGKKGNALKIFFRKVEEINKYLPESYPTRFKPVDDVKDLSKRRHKANAEWFYEDFYTIKDFKSLLQKEVNHEKLEEALAQGRSSLNEFLKEIDMRPSRYIALIEYDGDKMGKRRGNLDKEELMTVSQIISNFARETIPAVFNEYHGFLIYSGGEDVLGFASMSRAWELLNLINTKFLSEMNKGNTIQFTGSGSITFFPHNFPLQEALNISNKNLHCAKDDFERDSVVLGCVLPDSSEFVFGSKWMVRVDENQDYSILQLLAESVEWFSKGKKINETVFPVSRRFLYDVLEIIKLFYEPAQWSGKLITDLEFALQEEMTRLMMRHVTVKISPENKQGVKQECVDYIKKVKEVVLKKSSLNYSKFGLTNMEAFFKLIDFYVSRVEG